MLKEILVVGVVSMFISDVANAQAPDTLWTKTYGGTGYDMGYSVQECADGDFIIAGYTNSFGAGFCDVYLVRTDADGDTLWTQTYGGTDDDWGRSVQECDEGGFIIAGTTESFGAGNNDVYLIRTDANGDTLWTKTYGGTSIDYGNSVQQCTNGGFIIAGYTWSFGAFFDVYLIRTDADGDTLWTKTYGYNGTSRDYGYSVQECASGGFIIAGKTGDFFGVGYQDVYLVRTDADGDTLWTKTYGGIYDDWGYSVQECADGDFIIAGYTNSFGAGSDDVYLIRTDADGDTLWTKTYGGTDYDRGSSVQECSGGGFIVAGWTESFGAGSDDVYLIRTNTDGTPLWTQTYGGTDYDGGSSVQECASGGFIIAGGTESFGAGSGDVYLIRINPTMTFSTDDIKLNVEPAIFTWDPYSGASKYRITFEMIETSTDMKASSVSVCTSFTNNCSLPTNEWNNLTPAKWQYKVDAYDGSWHNHVTKYFIRINIETVSGNTNDKPIVFIHGLVGKSATWTDGNIIASEFETEGYCPWTFEYPNTWNIEQSAAGLKVALDYILNQSASLKADIIAHSMGGLVSRAYTVDMAEDLSGNPISYANNVDHLLMLATPNLGTFGTVIDIWKRVFLPSKKEKIPGDGPAWWELLESGLFLHELNYLNSLNSDIKHKVIYGYNFFYPGIPRVLLEQWTNLMTNLWPHDGIVTKKSATRNKTIVPYKGVWKHHGNITIATNSDPDMYNLCKEFIAGSKKEPIAKSSDSLLMNLGQVEGKIFGTDGTSLSGIRINVTTQELEDSAQVSPVVLISDINGNYEMPYLVPGEYILKISGKGYVSKNVTFEIDSGQHTLLNVTLEDTTTQYPTHSSVAINNDVPSTSSQNVTLNLHCDNATEMMFSEDPEFTGASWQTYDSIANFILSDTAGYKVVLAKFKNATGESDMTLDGIDWIEYTGGNISVTATSDSAIVFLDGNMTPYKTPYTITNLDTSLSHILSVQKEGYSCDPAFIEVSVSAGGTSNADFTLTGSQSPNTFSLQSPSVDSTITDSLLTFIWDESTDPDADDFVRYILYIATDSAFDSIAKVVSPIDTTTLTLSLPNSAYYWQVKAVDNHGSETWSNEIWRFNVNFIGSEEKDSISLPKIFELYANQPNPFARSTNIKYALPNESMVSLKIYDEAGRLVETLVNENKKAGCYTVSWDAKGLASGIYFIRFEAGEFKATKKLTILR